LCDQIRILRGTRSSEGRRQEEKVFTCPLDKIFTESANPTILKVGGSSTFKNPKSPICKVIIFDRRILSEKLRMVAIRGGNFSEIVDIKTWPASKPEFFGASEKGDCWTAGSDMEMPDGASCFWK
jgi:hypothetical protein